MLPARGAASHRRRRLAGGARAWGAIGALLVLAATLASAQQQQAPTAFADAPPAPAPVTMAANPSGCILTFDLANAPALVGGTITTEAGKPGSPLTTAGGVQVAGRLALQLATAACPRTWAELNATGLTGAKIVPTEEPTLRLLPAKLTAKVGKDLATITAANVTLAVSSSAMPQPLPPSPATLGGKPATSPNTWQGLLVTGTAASGEPPSAVGPLFKGAASPVPLSYVPTAAAPAPKANAAATFSFTGADATVFMSLQKLNFTFRSEWAAGGRTGPAIVWVATNLTSSSVLGCKDGGCGPNGRCAPPPADAADPRGRKGPAPACVCRCGFAGPTCASPDPAPPAKCPPFPSWPATFIAPSPPASLLSTGGGGGVLGSLPGLTAGGEPCTCAAGGSLAALLASSTCEPGWSGLYCDACTSDTACAASTGDPASTCSNSLEYLPRTVSKAYVCDLSDTVVGALVDPRKGYWFNCTTTPVEWPGLLDKKGRPRTGGSCELGIGLSTDPENPIVCTAQACQFVPGTSGVQCPTSSCACPQGPPGPDGVPACPAIAATYVSMIDGKPVDATCTAAGACTIDVKDFPIKLTAKCTAGDCQSDGAALLKGGVLEQPRDYSSVIAAIPIMALLALASVAGIQMMAATGRLAGGKGGAGGGGGVKGGAAAAATTAARGGVGGEPAGAGAVALVAKAAPRAPAHPIQELKWWDLSCTVPGTRFAPNHGGGGGGAAGGSGASHPTAAGGLGALVSSVAVSPTARRPGLPAFGGGANGRLAHATSSAAALSEAASRRAGAVSPGATPTAAGGADAFAPAAAASAAAPTPAPRAGWFGPARPRVHILRAAAGEARMGELVGVLGPSGCGKTTMLSILAGSVSSLSASSRVSGHITLDGEKRRGWASRLVAYVPQFDFLLPTLTVAETLRYSALLRLPASTAPADIAARVAATIEELGLTHVSGAQVGGSSGIRGVSGGERRRVTIGMELVIDPAIIVLDEPTSGLDSHTALNLMVTLKAVAAAGRIVMLSFHQPSPAMFDLLDRSFLMARGNVLYSGPPSGVPSFFEAAGCPVPSGTAAAEHMLTAVSDPKLRDPLLAYAGAQRRAAAEERAAGGGGGVGGGGGGAATAASRSADDDFTSDASEDGAGPRGGGGNATATPGGPLLTIQSGRSADLEAGAAGAAAAAGACSFAPCATTRRLRKPARTPFGRELAVLFWRTLTEIWRNPSLLAMHCIMALTMGLLCGGIFYNLKFDIAGAQGRLGAVFFALTLMALTSLTTVDLLTNERGLVVKECIAGYYRPVSYYLSKATLDGLLLRILPAILFAIPLYPLSGFQPGAPQVALFFCVLAVFSAAVGALSMAVTVGFGTAGRASLVMNLVLLLSLLFAGFLVNVNSITPTLRWVASLSVFRYAFEAMTTSEMSGIELTFAAPTGPGAQPITVQGLPGGGAGGGLSVDLKGDTFLQAIGLDSRKLLLDVIAIDLYWLAAVLLGVSLLYYTMPRALVVRAPEGSEGSRRGGRKGGAEQNNGAGGGGQVSKTSSFASLTGRLVGRGNNK